MFCERGTCPQHKTDTTRQTPANINIEFGVLRQATRNTYQAHSIDLSIPIRVDDNVRSSQNFKLFSMLIIRILNNYPDSSDFLQLFRDFLGRERPPREDPRVREDP